MRNEISLACRPAGEWCMLCMCVRERGSTEKYHAAERGGITRGNIHIYYISFFRRTCLRRQCKGKKENIEFKKKPMPHSAAGLTRTCLRREWRLAGARSSYSGRSSVNFFFCLAGARTSYNGHSSVTRRDKNSRKTEKTDRLAACLSFFSSFCF